MTSACVARNVSSELKTSTKNAGSRRATVSSSSTPKRRSVERRRAARSEATEATSGGGAGTGATSVFIREVAPVVLRRDPSFFQFSTPSRTQARSDGCELVAQVPAAAQRPLRLARRRLGQRAGADEHDVDGRHTDGV